MNLVRAINGWEKYDDSEYAVTYKKNDLYIKALMDPIKSQEIKHYDIYVFKMHPDKPHLNKTLYKRKNVYHGKAKSLINKLMARY